jgi:TolB-like protein/DNA-binding winged helix-turn-helix (wHTH) protein
MEELVGAETVLFGDFRLDRRRGLLARQNGDGDFAPVPIGSRALDILGLLIDRHGDLVSRDEILNTIWPGVVEGANVTVQISALRRALDDGRSDGSLIQTVPGRGYRFVAPVTRCEAEPRSVSGADENRGADDLTSVPVTSAPIVPTAVSPRRRGTLLAIAAVALVAMLVLAVSAWRLWVIERSSSARQVAAVASITPLIAPRLSIVVLPFENLSSNLDQQFFADGLTDDLTTDLSRITDLFVIARNTAFTYRNKLVDAKQIGRDLGVRYVLEGSVQRSGNHVRINSQLVDAESGAHLWAERFDRDAGDLFALQNEITSRIANALNAELTNREAARPIEHPDTLDYILRGRAAQARGGARENTAEAIRLYERALALDPRAVEAQSGLAAALASRGSFAGPEAERADFMRAEALLRDALATSPQYPFAHLAKGHLLRVQRHCEEAIPDFELALEVDRNAISALAGLGECKFSTGGSDGEAIRLVEQAIELSPRDPSIAFKYFWIGLVHLFQSRIGEAIPWLEKARRTDPRTPQPHYFLASAYGLKGELGHAAAELAEAQRLLGSDRYSTITRTKANGDLNTPALRDRFEGIFLVGLREAGMPEE